MRFSLFNKLILKEHHSNSLPKCSQVFAQRNLVLTTKTGGKNDVVSLKMSLVRVKIKWHCSVWGK